MSEAIDGMRQEKRDSLFLSATVLIEGYEPFITRVRNLSSGGMMIDSPSVIATDTVVSAELRGVGKIRGRIAWSTLGRAGVAFDMDIDPRLARSTTGTQKDALPTYLRPATTRRTGLAIR